MVLRMARPTRRKESSFLWFRKRVPADVQRTASGKRISFSFPAEVPGDPDIVVTTTLGTQVKFSLQTRDPAVAKQRHGLAAAQLERVCESFRRGSRPLTHKQRVALSGHFYRILVTGFGDDPGCAEGWRMMMEMSHRFAVNPEKLGPVVDELLAREKIITDAESRAALLTEFARALTEATEHM